MDISPPPTPPTGSSQSPDTVDKRVQSKSGVVRWLIDWDSVDQRPLPPRYEKYLRKRYWVIEKRSTAPIALAMVIIGLVTGYGVWALAKKAAAAVVEGTAAKSALDDILQKQKDAKTGADAIQAKLASIMEGKVDHLTVDHLEANYIQVNGNDPTIHTIIDGNSIRVGKEDAIAALYYDGNPSLKISQGEDIKKNNRIVISAQIYDIWFKGKDSWLDLDHLTK